MNYLYFCLAFGWCCVCVSATFLFCLRAFYLQKVEKLDPVNVVKTRTGIKKASAAKRIEQEETLEKLLENG